MARKAQKLNRGGGILISDDEDELTQPAGKAELPCDHDAEMVAAIADTDSEEPTACTLYSWDAEFLKGLLARNVNRPVCRYGMLRHPH